MKHKLERINEEAQEICTDIKTEFMSAQHNLSQIGNEYNRVTRLSRAPMAVLDEIDIQFKKATKFNDIDIAFLFIAIGLQCARFFLINQLTQVERAGPDNKIEKKLHQTQKKILSYFDNGEQQCAKNYFAPLNQIITSAGVPYDATSGGAALGLFTGANHRFATLGHDPVLGILFGTMNILTNTISCTPQNLPVVGTYHVQYDLQFKNPMIGQLPASTITALMSAGSRLDGDETSVAAALIKQILHIGTDLYTPCGIQLPGANLVLSNQNAEQLTKMISTGDLLKATFSAQVMALINFIIGLFHGLMYDERHDGAKSLYNVKTRRIILYSDVIASTSSVLITGIKMYLGDATAVKGLDIGGLLITIQRLFADTKFIHEIKKDFLKNELYDRIVGSEYDFMRGE